MTRYVLYLSKPKWHGWARWTLVRQHTQIPPAGVSWITVVESGWIHRGRNAPNMEFEERV